MQQASADEPKFVETFAASNKYILLGIINDFGEKRYVLTEIKYINLFYSCPGNYYKEINDSHLHLPLSCARIGGV